MKKILLLIGTMLMLASCVENSDTVQISKEEYRMLKGDTVRPKYPKHFELYEEGLNQSRENHGIVLGSDQHEYLITDDGTNSKNVEHYIDCELCLERKQQPTLKIKHPENEQQ
jgi:hypothetical protein